MKATTLFIGLCALALACARAGTIAVDVTGGQAALASGFGGLTDGWEFQVTATDGIVLDGLGFWDDQSDGFLLGQTFPVGVWNATNGVLLRSSVITSASALRPSLDPAGGWRVNAVGPIALPPGLYRIGALLPVSGANPIIDYGATFQTAPGVNLTRFMRQLGSSTLAMPNIPQATADSSSFGPTFTFTTGPLPPSEGVVAPSNYLATGTTGLNTLLRGSGFPRSYQMQFSGAVLNGLPVGARITDLRFRLSTNATANFPTNDMTWASYEVTLAQAANSIGNMTTNFDLNMVSPVLVRSGALSITGNTFTSGATPNNFAPLVVFGTAYTYKGGDLVMLFRHTGSDSTTTAFLDGVSQSSAGYGTDFRAFSANSFSAAGGAQASITIVEIGFAYSVSQTISRDGTNVVIVGTGGPPGGSYHVISATNITLPASQWSSAASNRFDASGNLRYTNALRKDVPPQFFRIAP